MNVSATTAFAGRRLPALAFGAALSVFASSAAWAQTIMDSPAASIDREHRAAASQDKAPLQAPEAIPGSKPRESAAPATRAAGDLQPTDALFDAINRGDMASARDALNRGADLDGVNILGMTPMELSVDLGRNDISFLLLSMRGEDSGRGSRAVGRGTPASGPSGKTAQAGKAVQPGKPAAPGPNGPNKMVAGRTAPAVNAVGAIRPVVTPKLFANDGGTPLPSAGFLGFGSGPASN